VCIGLGLGGHDSRPRPHQPCDLGLQVVVSVITARLKLRNIVSATYTVLNACNVTAQFKRYVHTSCS